jgi:histidine ammonia-lyase
MSAAQGVDFRLRRAELTSTSLGAGTAIAYHLIRDRVPFLENDVVLAPYFEEVRRLVADGSIKEAVESVVDYDRD